MTEARLEPIFTTKSKMITSMDATTMKLIVSYCYTNVMRMNDYEQIFKVLKSARKYGMVDLIAQCHKYLYGAIRMSNTTSFWNLSQQYGFRGMNKFCGKIINDLFMEIVMQPSFNELTPHDFGKIISSNRLNSPNEEAVFAAFLKWLTKSDALDMDVWHYEHKVDAMEKSDEISALLSHIRFPLMSPEVHTYEFNYIHQPELNSNFDFSFSRRRKNCARN